MSEPPPFDAIDNLTADELRQRLQSIRAIIAHAPVPIAIAHDPDCRVVSANRALATLLGVDLEANVSLTPRPGEVPLYRIQREGRDLAPEDLPMQYAIAHRTAVSNEIEIVRADGRVVHVENDVEPLYDTSGRIYGCVSVCVDVTERTLAEAALRDADRRKDEFLATLSHELRNPLAPIRAALEVMRLAGDDARTVEEARRTMERQLAHLARITDDLLDVSRITHDKLTLHRERVDLRTVLSGAVEAARPVIDAQRHSLGLDLPEGPLWAEADPTRLAQAFSNLLNNAAKYTNAGGAIRVRVLRDGDTAVVAVSDTGIGISFAMLPRVFDMFTQLQPSRDRPYGGLGIGLTLAKRLVELHGGTIEAASPGVGRGTTFTVRLPLLTPIAHELTTHAGDRARPARSCRILIAEDNDDAAEMMRVMLSLKGHDVAVASDGEEAVAMATAGEPAIAFLDIGMPRMDGYEAARRIRERLGRRIVLVALTGWGQDEDKRLAAEAGFDHHLTKPPDLDVMDRLIADSLR